MTRPATVPYPAGSRAGEMRAEFDAAFSRPPRPPAGDLTDVLALRIGAEPCLLRLSDIAEVIARPVLTRVPTAVPALLGLAVGRGSPVAAYDLGLLLGRAPVAPHWLVLAAAEPGIAIAFEHFDGYRQIPLTPDQSDRVVGMAVLINAIRHLPRPARSSNQESDS